jgi:hypothetical protein
LACLCALTLAAEVARVVGKAADRAAALLDQARAAAADSHEEARLAEHYLGLGRLAETFDLVMPRLVEAPKDTDAQQTYATALEEAHERALAAASPAGPAGVPETCPCRSGRDWSDCCRPGEQAALDRFGDRRALYALRQAIADYIERAPFAVTVDSHISEWIADIEDATGASIGDLEGLARLAAENAWIAVDVGTNSAGGGDTGAAAGMTPAATAGPRCMLSSATPRLRRSWRAPAGNGSTTRCMGYGRLPTPSRGPGSGAPIS